MPHVIVLQHVAPEGPGTVAVSLADRGIDTRLVRIDTGQVVPSAFDGAAGLVVMGGPMGVYELERYSHLRRELRLIEAALKARIPILGICLGSQLLAAALGARVYVGPQKELGWYEVRLRDAAREDRLWRGVARTFTPLHWHGDVFDLPSGAVALASSALTEHQAFRYGDNAYGLLFHLEMERPQIEAMVDTFRDEVVGAGQLPEAILADTAAHLPQTKEVGAVVFGSWAAAVLDSGAGEGA
ncbi:MAG: hypothetical protein CL878_07385 [Dehalococcoidia bacterium]|nr:hypothetical protein [Dehalococcoidia bacterium]